MEGQYRFWDGGKTDNSGLGTLIARLQQKHGVGKRLRLVVVDNNYFGLNLAFDGLGVLDQPISWAPGLGIPGEPWVTTADGNLDYRRVNATTLTQPDFGLEQANPNPNTNTNTNTNPDWPLGSSRALPWSSWC